MNVSNTHSQAAQVFQEGCQTSLQKGPRTVLNRIILVKQITYHLICLYFCAQIQNQKYRIYERKHKNCSSLQP